MKKSFKTLVVIAAAAFTLASCEKQEVNVPSTSERTITLNFNAMPFETKTAFGEKEGTTYPTLWTETSTVQASLNFASVVSGTLTPSSDNKSATFSATFKVPETAPEEYVIYALSPKFLGVSPNNSTISFEIPTSQSPTEASVDEAAQFVFGSTTLTALPDPDDPDAETKKSTVSPIDISFSHLTAYGKMTIKDEAVVAAGIKSVSLTASAPIAHRWNYSPADGTYSENSTASSITLETTSAEGIWFAIAPADLSAGTLKVTVSTENGTYEKTIDFTGTGKGNFKAGTVASFGVKNFTKVEDVVYNLVTDVTDLTPNSVVIIAAAASNVAISTTQSNNNRASTGVSKSDDGAQILNPGDAVETFIVETGANAGTYAFLAQTTEGYIYASGGTSSNQLKTTDALNLTSSWTVSIAEGGVATIKCANTAVTKNWLRFNSSNSLFSCYASGQQDVAIYKLEGSGDEPVEPVTIFPEHTEVSFPAAGGTSDEIFIDFDGESCDLTASVDVSWITLQSETIVDGDGVIFTVAENTTSVERTGVITLSAPTIVPATITVTQEAGEDHALTIAEIKSTIGTSTNDVEFSGSVSNLLVTGVSALDSRYAYVEDATGAITVYLKGHGLEKGNLINGAISGKGKVYNGLLEITALDFSNATVAEGTVTETEVSLEDLLADYDNFVARRVKLVGLTTKSEINLTKSNFTFYQGTSSAQFRPHDSVKVDGNVVKLYANAVFDLVCYPSQYNGVQISIVDPLDLAVTDEGDVPTSGPYFEETLLTEDSFNKFTIDNVTLPDSGLTYVWSYAKNYGAKASAYSSKCYETESWLISPEIDITDSTNPVLSFSHAANQFKDGPKPSESLAVMVKVGNGAWSDLEVSAWPAGSNWTFVDATASLAAYKGKIQIAFKYTSSESYAGTWEFKNLKVAEAE